MPFTNPIVAGTTLVRQAITSDNYSAGASGWAINRDGTAEFQSATIRGSVALGGTAPSAREILGGTVPSELVTYYAAGTPETQTAPETVVALIEQAFDGQGNYTYRALVIDSTLPQHLTCLVQGRVIGVTPTEYSRTVINPNVGATIATLIDFYNSPVYFESNSPDTDVLSVGEPTQPNGTWVVDAGGGHYFGPGTATADTFLGRGGAHLLVADGIACNTAAAGSRGVAETWHPVTFVNNWSNGAGTSTPLQYRKVASPAGGVQILGSFHSPNPFVGTTVFNLPVGYRPGHDQYVTICRDVATFDRVKIGSGAGDLSVSNTTTGVDWFINCIIQTDI